MSTTQVYLYMYNVCGGGEGLFEDVREQHARLSLSDHSLVLGLKVCATLLFSWRVRWRLATRHTHSWRSSMRCLLRYSHLLSAPRFSSLIVYIYMLTGERRFRDSTGSQGGSTGQETRGNGTSPSTESVL